MQEHGMTTKCHICIVPCTYVQKGILITTCTFMIQLLMIESNKGICGLAMLRSTHHKNMQVYTSTIVPHFKSVHGTDEGINVQFDYLKGKLCDKTMYIIPLH